MTEDLGLPSPACVCEGVSERTDTQDPGTLYEELAGLKMTDRNKRGIGVKGIMQKLQIGPLQTTMFLILPNPNVLLFSVQ